MTAKAATKAAATAVIVAIAALALGACGDDNKDSAGSGDTATSGAIATGVTTGTDTTTKNGTTKTSTDDRKGGSGKSGGSDDSGNGSTTNRSSPADGSGAGSDNAKTPDPSKELSGKNVKSTAKTVCSSFLPKALERDLKNGDKSAQEIAKDYSKAFPSDQRDDAYAGCLAGLKTKD